MEVKDANKMVVVDEKGQEHLMEILFTYDNEERKTSYVFFYDPKDKNQDVMVMRYNEKKELEEIDDDEEYEEVEEVFESWQNDPKIQELKEENN